MCFGKDKCGAEIDFDNKKGKGVCEGLSGADCAGDKVCDTLAEFKCADWVNDKTHTPKCALTADCNT